MTTKEATRWMVTSETHKGFAHLGPMSWESGASIIKAACELLKSNGGIILDPDRLLSTVRLYTELEVTTNKAQLFLWKWTGGDIRGA